MWGATPRSISNDGASSSQSASLGGTHNHGCMQCALAPETRVDRPRDDNAEIPPVSPTLLVDAAGRHRRASQFHQFLQTLNRNERHQPANPQEEKRRPVGLGLRALMQTTIATLEEEDRRNRDINSFFYERLKHRTILPKDESQLEGDICSICHERFAAGNDVGTLNCMHIFHVDSIRLWLRPKNLCPLCKRKAL